MKKLFSIVMLGILFLAMTCPVVWAENGDTSQGVSGTPAEFKDLEKTMKQDRIDRLEVQIADLKQDNQFLSERVKMLERSVNDLKDKVDRSFR